MPIKRKQNSGPMVKRKLGSAKPATPAAAGGAATAGVDAEGAAANALSAGATQPLGAIAPAAAAKPAAAPAPKPAAGSPVVPGVSISVDDGSDEGEEEPAPTEGGGAKPTRRSVKRKKAKGKKDASAPIGEGEGATSSTPPSADGAGRGGEAEGGGAGAEKAKRPKRPSKRKQRRAARKEAKAAKRAAMTPLQRALRLLRTLLIVLVAAVVLVAGAAVGALSYHRWYAYDDALDIQGTWYVSGTNTPIEVTGDAIELTPEVAYHYTLDPSSKTIAFTFGRLKGQGHYRFSLDRQYLVIFDGEYSWEQSLSSDVSWLLKALADEAMSTPNNLAQGAFYNVTLLSRSSAEESDVSASVVATSEGPRVVWSAPDAEGSGAGAEGGAAGGAGGDPDAQGADPTEGSRPEGSGATDVDALLGAINDLPAE